MKKNIKALLLFSGGLDSLLAAKILQRQGIDTTGLLITNSFIDTEIPRKMAKEIGLKLQVIDVSEEQLALVKSSKHGRGKGMNPCIDCRVLMLRKAQELLVQKKFDFVVTGEVLGERPMTQGKNAMKLVEKESGLQSLLVRPLSAQLIQITIPEKKGWIDRRKLYAIFGRSRKEQIKLAKKFGLKDYPSPAGGCLLTDPEFAQKLRELLKVHPKADLNDVELLKNGRQIWEGKTRIIIGRDKQENANLAKLALPGDVLIELKNIPGPTALIRCYTKTKKVGQKLIEKAEEQVQHHSLKARGKKKLEFKIQQR